MPSSPTYSSKPSRRFLQPAPTHPCRRRLGGRAGLRDLSRQLLHGGGALSSATKLQQSLFVSGVFDDFSTVVTSLVRGDDLLALQDADPSVRGGQDEVFIRRGMRNGVIIDDKLANLGHDPGPSGLFSPLAVVQPSVPSQQGFRCDDTGDFCQEFPAKRLTLYRAPTSLVGCFRH